MFNLFNLREQAFGLDISDLSLKIIKLKKRRTELVLASFGQEKIKPGIIKQGEIRNEKALTKIIKDALTKVKGEKIRTKQVIASLPEEKSFLQIIQMPRMSEEDLKSAVIYEAENYIPLPIEQVYLDSQIVQPVSNHLDHVDETSSHLHPSPRPTRWSGARVVDETLSHLHPSPRPTRWSGARVVDVLIAALPRKTVDPYVACLKKAGLKPLTLEIESLAVARALIKNEITAQPVLLIDLGQTRTSFIIFSGHSVRFTSSIPVSGNHFTEIISKALKVNLAKAENLKIGWGLEEKIELKIKDGKTEKKIKRGEIFEALIPGLIDLIGQIKKYLVYYQTYASPPTTFLRKKVVGGQGVEKILLCGGGANLKGLADFLALEIKLPVEIGNPWVNILPESLANEYKSSSSPFVITLAKEVWQLPFEKSLSYTTALGLALRGVKEKI